MKNSDKVRDLITVLTPPTNDNQAAAHANALTRIDSGIMLCADGCFNVGIAGGCGHNCYVYQAGDCPEPDEMRGGRDETRL
jgi:hypothetical protein